MLSNKIAGSCRRKKVATEENNAVNENTTREKHAKEGQKTAPNNTEEAEALAILYVHGRE